MILHVLLTPTNFCFHDKVTTSLTGVLGIKWSPQNIGIAFTEMSSKMQYCLFPNLGIIRNMKPTYVFCIPFPKRHTHSDTLAEKLDHVWSCPHTLSKPWENFMFSTISSIRNTSQHKAQFTVFCYQFDIYFYASPIDEGSPEDMGEKELFFLFSYIQWNMITTKLTSTLPLNILNFIIGHIGHINSIKNRLPKQIFLKIGKQILFIYCLVPATMSLLHVRSEVICLPYTFTKSISTVLPVPSVTNTYLVKMK